MTLSKIVFSNIYFSKERAAQRKEIMPWEMTGIKVCVLQIKIYIYVYFFTRKVHLWRTSIILERLWRLIFCVMDENSRINLRTPF